MKINIVLFLSLLISTVGLSQKSDHLSMQMNFDGSSVQIQAVYEANIVQDTDSIYFLLNPGVNITSITSEGLTSFDLSPKEQRPFPFWKLVFDRALKKGELVEVKFEYQIDLKEQNHLNSNWIELNSDKLWFPNYNDLDNMFSYDVSISNFPDAFSLIGHQDAIINRNGDQITIKKSEPWAEVLILAGGDMKQWSFNDSITVHAHKSVQDSIIMSIGTKVKNTIDFLNETFENNNPISNFSIVLRNTSSSEIGFQFNRKNLIVTGIEWDDYANLSHEVAHYWWSNANFITYPWINESFANYSMYLVTEKFSPGHYEKIMSSHLTVAEQAIPVENAQLFTPDSYNSYYVKGAILLKELAGKIGEEKMKALLISCIKNEIKSTSGFLDQVENVTDIETRTYFEALLKR